jgi:hypothetical protein
MALMMEERPPECGKILGNRPSWMTPDQYDQCYCSQPPKHRGKCYCGRHSDDAEEPRRKYLAARDRLW